MTDWKILAIKNSWSYLLLDSEEAGALFYEKLFELDPSLRPLFKHSLADQSKKLVDMLTLMIANLQCMDEMKEEINALAKRHEQYGTRPEHYQTVGLALIQTLEIQLADQWSPELAEAWQEVYAIWTEAMTGSNRT
jgi:nitric oxide dioxygenase